METMLIREVHARYRWSRRKPFKVDCPLSAAEFLRKVIKDNTKEHFVALYLNNGNAVVAFATVFIGTATETYASPREIFQLAVLAGACSVIVAHNHPSGVMEPSPEDMLVTRNLKDAGEILNIPVLDHLIMTDIGFVSMNEAEAM